MIDKNINISWYSNLADSSYQELQNLTNILKKRYFKDIKFPGKAKEIHKIDKKNDVIDISNFVYENKEKRFNQCIKECKKKYVDLLLIGTMFLLKILMHPCMIMHYFMAENIVIIVLSFQ